MASQCQHGAAGGSRNALQGAGHHGRRLDNPVSTMGFFVKQLTYHYLTALNGVLFLYPNQLSCDWTSGSVPPVVSLLDPRNLLTVGAYAFLVLAVRHIVANCRDQTAVAMALTLAALPYLPASNLLFPIGFVVAERVLYLPSMGLSLLVAIGWNRLYQTR
ncbi:transmembrane and TPR repeat-containing protein 3-like [Tropilaelaps mercedesae]|uniref:Transmembrane and TPR repeat-containing protein 3-like n=1 Tax=Tropilaelaps mercedesae TaxID=418985 RepID=A0A1V9X3N6_9ACAR|nr:transmembrane and TPR repeat-containing protein 3-like [Tropilaelaps mercedesae]